MLRRVDYRAAINLFVFTALWFFIGAVVLWSPVPGALGIGSGLFVMWLLLFFGVLAVAGSALTLAAINAAFPDARAAQNLEPRTENLPASENREQRAENRVAEGSLLGAEGASPGENREPKTEHSAGENREQRTEDSAGVGAPRTQAPKTRTASPARTRKPTRAPMWAPPPGHAETPESVLPTPPDAPTRGRGTQRGDA